MLKRKITVVGYITWNQHGYYTLFTFMEWDIHVQLFFVFVYTFIFC